MGRHGNVFLSDHETGRHAGVGGTFVGPGDLQQQTVLVAIGDESNPDGQAADEAGWDREARVPGDRRGPGDLRPTPAAAVAPDMIDQFRRPVAGRQQHLGPLLPEERCETFGIGGPLQSRDAFW